jgi:hypothetical protein
VAGKAVSSAADTDGSIPYLLAGAAHGAGEVLAERLIEPKTNEVPGCAPLMRGLNKVLLAGWARRGPEASQLERFNMSYPAVL